MDEKVDIFGLAWVFYFMLNGWLPFGDDRWSQDRFMQETGGIPEFNLEWHSGFVEVSAFANASSKFLLTVSMYLINEMTRCTPDINVYCRCE